MDTVKEGMNRKSHQFVQNTKNTKLCTMSSPVTSKSNNYVQKTKNIKSMSTRAQERLQPLEFAPTKSSTPIKTVSARRDRSRGKDRRSKKTSSPTNQDSGFESLDSDSGSILESSLNILEGSFESPGNFSDDSGVSSLDSSLNLSKGSLKALKSQRDVTSPVEKVGLLDLFRSQLNISKELDCSTVKEKIKDEKLDRVGSKTKISCNKKKLEKKDVDILGLVKSKFEDSNGCKKKLEKKNVDIFGLVKSHFYESKKLDCVNKNEPKKVDLLGLVNSKLNNSDVVKAEKKDVNLLALLKSSFEADTSGYESSKTDESVKVIKKGFKLKKGRIPCLTYEERFACTVNDVETKEPIPDIPEHWKAGFYRSLKFPKLSLIE